MSEFESKPLYKPVLVIWEDACSIDEWIDPVEVSNDSLPLIHSVGFLIEKDSQRTTLALNHNTDSNDISCVMIIPNGMIRAFVHLG